MSDMPCRIDAREQSLGGRFFVTGGSVDLAGEEEPFDLPRLE